MRTSYASAFIQKQVKLCQTPLKAPELEDKEDAKVMKGVVSKLNKSISTRRNALLHVSRSKVVIEQLAILADEQATKRRRCERKGIVQLAIDENNELAPDWIDSLPLEWDGDDYREALERAKEQQRRKQMLEEQIEHYERLLKMMQ